MQDFASSFYIVDVIADNLQLMFLTYREIRSAYAAMQHSLSQELFSHYNKSRVITKLFQNQIIVSS